MGLLALKTLYSRGSGIELLCEQSVVLHKNGWIYSNYDTWPIALRRPRMGFLMEGCNKLGLNEPFSLKKRDNNGTGKEIKENGQPDITR